jgi:hypothetical protein
MKKESLQHQRDSLGDCIFEGREMKKKVLMLVKGVLMLRMEKLEMILL